MIISEVSSQVAGKTKQPPAPTCVGWVCYKRWGTVSIKTNWGNNISNWSLAQILLPVRGKEVDPSLRSLSFQWAFVMSEASKQSCVTNRAFWRLKCWLKMAGASKNSSGLIWILSWIVCRLRLSPNITNFCWVASSFGVRVRVAHIQKSQIEFDSVARVHHPGSRSFAIFFLDTLNILDLIVNTFKFISSLMKDHHYSLILTYCGV